MRKDDVTLDVARRVRNLVKKRLNTEFTDEEVFQIIDFQFVNVAHAIHTNQNIQLPAFGTFHAPDIRVKRINEKFVELGKDPKFNYVESSRPKDKSTTIGNDQTI